MADLIKGDIVTWVAGPNEPVMNVRDVGDEVRLFLPWAGKFLQINPRTARRIAWLILKYSIIANWNGRPSWLRAKRTP
jgi:hypothetical protein